MQSSHSIAAHGVAHRAQGCQGSDLHNDMHDAKKNSFPSRERQKHGLSALSHERNSEPTQDRDEQNLEDIAARECVKKGFGNNVQEKVHGGLRIALLDITLPNSSIRRAG